MEDNLPEVVKRLIEDISTFVGWLKEISFVVENEEGGQSGALKKFKVEGSRGALGSK